MLASEYGWSLETCLDVPFDQLAMLRHAIMTRKGIVCHFVNDGESVAQESLEYKVKRILTTRE